MTRRKAFTLVELLVVIGIIAVLIGILLPTLSKARDAGQRTVCLSNLRELGNSIRIYGAQYKDQIPIGYMDEHQFSYFVNWRNSNGTKVSMMGLLAISKLMPNPKAFYCPTMIDDPQFGYNVAANRWPNFQDWPNDPLFNPPLPSGPNHTRITYNQRPVANWPAANETYVNASNFHIANWIPYLGSDSLLAPSKHVYALPKMSKLKNRAMITDLIVDRSHVLKMHKNGINILYAHGGATWYDMSKWVRPQVPAANPADPTVTAWRNWRSVNGVAESYNIFFLEERPTVAGTPKGVWIELDKLSR
jgi:prepilin-type N-terminal cleavage/methylation domain-containing protein